MSTHLDNPQQTTLEIITFIQQTFKEQRLTDSVIAVSGGIDSAVALTLLTRALGKDHVFPVLLPYLNQSTQDSRTIITFNQIPHEHVIEHNIGETVDIISHTALIKEKDQYRKGNIMARTRMIFLFDEAKKRNALVCGTENKSEKYLGYFTRFGDQASDIEPIEHLFKTQVRELAQHLQLPSIFWEKQPSAGLWENQTDEQELGFSYEIADVVIDHMLTHAHIPLSNIPKNLEKKILKRIQEQSFKRNVPYSIL